MTCEIRVYDKDLNWLGIISTAESVQWSSGLFGGGSFELHIEPTKPGAAELMKTDNVIILNQNRTKCGIIEDFRIERSASGCKAVIFGSSALKSFARRRITVPPTETQKTGSLGYDRISGTAEQVLRHYVNMHMVAPYDTKRAIKLLKLDAYKGLGAQTVWQSRYKNLYDELSAIAEFTGFGIGIYPDVSAKSWTFELYEGKNRTRSQSLLQPVTFKSEYLNIKSYRYSESVSAAKNTGFAGGKGDNENRLIYTLGAENEALDRKECFLDCANAADANELKLYGTQKLADFPEIKGLEAEILPNRVFVYESDYFLGDLVSVDINELGLHMDANITEAREVYEHGNMRGLELRLGSKALNIFSGITNKTEIR